MTTPDALRATAERWLAEGRPAIDISVLQHRGSVPREAGTHMLVSAHEVAGTIGGGHLEQVAITQARRLLAEQAGGPTPPKSAAIDQHLDQHFALGPSLGQCCGGSLTLRHQVLGAASLAGWPVAAPRFHLQLHGAGHVGRAIVRLLEGINCRVSWVDERGENGFPKPPNLDAPHIEQLASDDPAAEVAGAPPGAVYLVLTHSHALDLRITEAVLRRGDFAWLGLIGSATKRARFMHRYEQRGIAPELLARLTCPIGLPGVQGKEPEVIAIAVVAQLLGLPARTSTGA
jgi:xanthine dehydrogenase accessory factor